MQEVEIFENKNLGQNVYARLIRTSVNSNFFRGPVRVRIKRVELYVPVGAVINQYSYQPCAGFVPVGACASVEISVPVLIDLCRCRPTGACAVLAPRQDYKNNCILYKEYAEFV